MNCNCLVSDTIIKTPPKLIVLDTHHRVGPHVSLKNTLYETITQPTAIKSQCVQMYLGGRQNYKVRNIDNNDKAKCIEYCETYNKTFYIHCPLIANLSKDPNTILDDDSILTKSFKAVKSEITQMNELPVGCVLHIGSKGTINNVIKNINSLQVPRNKNIKQTKLLLLENSAGQGTSLGRSETELRKLFEGIDKNTVGLCIDTQHLFGSGLNKLQSHEDVVKLFDICESVYGIPDLIHLNDSKRRFNSHVDRHENIGKGYIWGENDEGLKTLLDICYEKDIDCILETPNSNTDMDTIREKYMHPNVDVFEK